MKAVLALVAVAACSPDHAVVLDLGITGDPSRFPTGFGCERTNGRLMVADALVGGNLLAMSVVVDFLDMHGGQPLCRGEHIAAWCEDNGGCLPLEIPGGMRYCTEMRVVVNPMDIPGSAVKFNAALAGLVVIEDAPDVSVMVRVVGTTQPCAAVSQWTGTSYPTYTPANVVGCAYSCPVFIDQIDRLTVGIDAFDTKCESQVLACAAGP